MREAAVITGASMGIGEEFAKQLARRGEDLVLVARSADKLEALAAKLRARFGVEAWTLACDLSEPGAAQRVEEFLRAEGLRARWLVNNAGFGGIGAFAGQDPERIAAMIRLNIGALVDLTRLLLPSMVAARDGRVINVASMAGFQAVPYFGVYAATKAFVVSFSEALAEEVRGQGVGVLALCPGPTRTNFHVAARMDEKLFRRGQTAREVVRRGLAASDAGRTICMTQMAWSVALQRLAPRALVRRATAIATRRLLGGNGGSA